MRTTPKKAKTLDGDVTEQEIKTRDLWPIADLAARLDVSAEAIRKRVIRHSMKVMRQGPDGSMIFDQGTAWTLAQYFNARRSRTPSFDFPEQDDTETATAHVSQDAQTSHELALLNQRMGLLIDAVMGLEKAIRLQYLEFQSFVSSQKGTKS
jgi:hypothetical protein